MNCQNQKNDLDRLNLRPSKQELEDFPLSEMKMDLFWSSLIRDEEITEERIKIT